MLKTNSKSYHQKMRKLLASSSLIAATFILQQTAWCMEKDPPSPDFSSLSQPTGECSFVVKLSSTQLSRHERAGGFPKNFSYSWNIKNFLPNEKFTAIRNYAENFPFLDLRILMKSRPNMPANQQYSVHFTNRDILNVLKLYRQGKLDLSWSYNGLGFNQYSADATDFRHTLAVTSDEQGVTYYKQQRYTDNRFSQVGDVFFDSHYQVEYWYDDKKNKWIMDHPYLGEIEYSTHYKALKDLRNLGKISSKNEIPSYFLHPYKQWLMNRLCSAGVR